jgi:hypothetical protein
MKKMLIPVLTLAFSLLSSLSLSAQGLDAAVQGKVDAAV